MNPPNPTGDDSDFAPEELEAAVDETPAAAEAPEVNAETRDLTTWDQAPGATGNETPAVREDDETTIAEQLVTEGIEEAERDRRIAASDPDFQP